MRRKGLLEAEICGKLSVNLLACGQGTRPLPQKTDVQTKNIVT